MGPEDQSKHPDQPMPSQQEQIAAALTDLTARVTSIEHELAQLRSASPSAAPHPPPPSLRTVSPPNFVQHLPAPAHSLEDRIGSQLFSRIGIVALLIATTLFLRWAIDNHWIGPVGRILAGLTAGVAVVLWSERFRRQGFPAFSYALKAIGGGALYLSLWAAFQLYGLLPAGVALGAMILVTAWNAYMSWAQNSELLAVYALAGAFATPLLLSTGGNHEIFLFTYLLAIDIATVLLVRLRPWPRLLLGSFPITVAFFIAWYVDWYGAAGLPEPLATTTIFIALFFLAFLAPSFQTAPSASPADNISHVLLPLANAAFVALALYCVLQDAGYHELLPWMCILFAVLYLSLMRLPQPPITSALHLTLAVVFLTIAIPLKVSGRWITVGWLAEGAALLWVAERFSMPASDRTPNRILRRLASASLALGFLSTFLQPFLEAAQPQAVSRSHLSETAFLNPRFYTALFSLFVFALAAGIALRAHRASAKADKPEITPEQIDRPSWLEIAAASILAFNLIAVFATVREINLHWTGTLGNSEADLQRSLAVSAFLMLYGALLFTAGFWRRSAFLRWQALILIVSTIAKAFLYDLRNLSQGYRVLSFLGLGALLMTISFAYQKDWLSLRTSPSQPIPQPISPTMPQEETHS